jgi:hypothetical protein
LGRTVNALHVHTREHVVRRELLIREGEACRDEALAQTERELRALVVVEDRKYAGSAVQWGAQHTSRSMRPHPFPGGDLCSVCQLTPQ